MLITNNIADGAGLHPFESIQTGRIAADQDTVDQAGCFIVTQRLGQHRPDIVVVADPQTGLPANGLDKFIQHIFDVVPAHVFHLCHGNAHTLNLFRPHVLEDLGSIRFAQRHQQNRGLLDPRNLAPGFGRR